MELVHFYKLKASVERLTSVGILQNGHNSKLAVRVGTCEHNLSITKVFNSFV